MSWLSSILAGKKNFVQIIFPYRIAIEFIVRFQRFAAHNCENCENCENCARAQEMQKNILLIIYTLVIWRNIIGLMDDFFIVFQ